MRPVAEVADDHEFSLVGDGQGPPASSNSVHVQGSAEPRTRPATAAAARASSIKDDRARFIIYKILIYCHTYCV